jgi:putative lipoic acid-binding regulatory protein
MTQIPAIASARKDSLLEFPCVFPIKVMGLKVAAFTPAILAIARTHDADFDPATLEMRESSAGKYLGLTLAVRVNSQTQLDAIYRELSGHPLVKVVL